jgi:hypothetical protein
MVTCALVVPAEGETSWKVEGTATLADRSIGSFDEAAYVPARSNQTTLIGSLL